MSIYNEYRKAKAELDRQKEVVDNLQRDIYRRHAAELNAKQEGSVKWNEDGHTITVTKKLTYTVDQKEAANCPGLFAIKYSYSKTKFKELSPADQAKCREMLTTKVAKPSFEVEVADG